MDKITAEILKLLIAQTIENKRRLLDVGKALNLRFELHGALLQRLADVSEPRSGLEAEFDALKRTIKGLAAIDRSAASDSNKEDFAIDQMDGAAARIEAIIGKQSGLDSSTHDEGNPDGEGS